MHCGANCAKSSKQKIWLVNHTSRKKAVQNAVQISRTTMSAPKCNESDHALKQDTTEAPKARHLRSMMLSYFVSPHAANIVKHRDSFKSGKALSVNNGTYCFQPLCKASEKALRFSTQV